MGELDPAVLAERLLRLKRTYPFDAFSPEGLTLLAATGREVVCPGRTLLVSEGERASAHWVALTGRLRALRGGEPLPGDPIKVGAGGLSILTESPLPCDVVAEPGTVLFVLDADALLETLEEHGRLARTGLRAMARSVLDARRRERERREPPAVTVVSGKDRRPVDLVGRMMVLRAAAGLPTRNAAVLTRLARAARMESIPRGRNLWPDPTAPADLVVVIDGALDGRPDVEEGPRAGRGALYGLMEALASVPRATPVLTTAESTAMVVSHAEIQEALEDDDRICLALIRLAAHELWNAFWRAHPPGGTSVSQ